MRFAIFPVHVSEVLRLPLKSDARSYKCCACHTQSSFQNWSLMLQNAAHLRKSAPWPPNISDEHVSCTAPATENASFQILFKCPTPAIVFGNARKPTRFLTSDNVHNPWRRPRGTTSERPKVLRTRRFFALLTWKRASRHNGVHFFDISTSKSESEHGVLCAFWLGNVLRATTACNFSSLIWPHGSAPAALASLLFDPPEPQIIGKRSESPLFYLFAHLHLLSSHSFSSLIFSLLLFSSLTVPTSAFPSLHIVGSLTSKLPSITVRGTTRGREKLLLCFLNQWSQEQIINQKLRPKMNRSMINDKMSSIFKDCKSLFDVFRCVSMLNGCSKMVQLVAFCSSHVSEATEAARSPAQNAHFSNSVDENGPQHSRDRLTKWTDMDTPTSHVGPIIWNHLVSFGSYWISLQ